MSEWHEMIENEQRDVEIDEYRANKANRHHDMVCRVRAREIYRRVIDEQDETVEYIELTYGRIELVD